MNYHLLILWILVFYVIFGIVSPTVRNFLKLKNNQAPENNLGGIIAKKFYKKK